MSWILFKRLKITCRTALALELNLCLQFAQQFHHVLFLFLNIRACKRKVIDSSSTFIKKIICFLSVPVSLTEEIHLSNYLSSCVEVCCWFSPLLQEVFLQVLWFSPLLKKLSFLIPFWMWKLSPICALYWIHWHLNIDLFIYLLLFF